MTYPHDGAANIWRDGAGGVHNPSKAQIRDWGARLEGDLDGLSGDFGALARRTDALEAQGVTGYRYLSGGPVAAASTVNLILSGEQVVDGVTTSASRVLVKDQALPSENGIYITAVGAWARATDFDEPSETGGVAVYVAGGAGGAGKTYISYSSVANVGVDAVVWVEGPSVGPVEAAPLTLGQERLWPSGEAPPDGWYATGDSRNGQQVITDWHPLLLFANGEDGVIFDPADQPGQTVAFQDAAESITAAANDPVRVMRDLSGNGHHIRASSDAARPARRTDGRYWWLEFDGADDMLSETDFASALTDWPSIAVASSVTPPAGDTRNSFPLSIANNGSEVRFLAFRQYNNATTGLRYNTAANGSASATITEHYAGPVTMIANPRGVPDARVNNHACSNVAAQAFEAQNVFALGGIARATPEYTRQDVYAAVAINRPLTESEIVLLDRWLASKSPVGEARRADVFALWWQSNTVGRAVYDSAFSHPSGVWQFSVSGGSESGLIAPTVPLNHFGAASSEFGFDVTFSVARKAIDPDTPLVLLAAAEGATGFITNDWNKGHSNYDAAVALWNRFHSMYDRPIKAFIGFGGETDANNLSSGSAFEAALDAAIANMRADCNGADGDTPFLLATLADEFTANNFTYGNPISLVLADSEDRLHQVAVVDTSGLTTSDLTHYDTDSMKKLGRRADRKLRQMGV